MTTNVLFNPFVPSFRTNPYLQYVRLQEGDPVHWSGALNAFVLTRYEDCLAVLRDPQRFSSDARNAGGPLASVIAEQRARTPLGQTATVLGSDPPVHTRLRGIVNRAFTPRRVAELAPRIEEITRDLLDHAPDSGEFEVMTGLAQPLPVIVIAELLGVPPGDRGRFKDWSNALAATTTLVQDERIVGAARAAARELIDYFRVVVEERERDPRDDLISALLRAEAEGDRLTREELLAFAILLLVAGNETTTNLLANGLGALLRHPAVLQAVRRDTALVPSAVEEMLRFDSPVQGVVRFTTQDVEVGGRPLPKGSALLCLVGAANRDPLVFPEPETFDITRADNRHLSFGHGPHFCLGAPLARLEAQVAFRALLARWGRIEPIAGGTERAGTLLLRGAARLTVKVAP